MEDRTLLATFLVSNTGDSGPGSLRQAILDSNNAAGATNTIDFDISSSGVQTIVPLSSLPAISNPVLIDGFSQPGYSGTPLIEIKGSQAGTGDGLTITGSGVTVRGVGVDSFSQGAGIHLTGTGATDDWIYGNFLGTNPAGTLADPNNEGVEIDAGAANNLIGTNGDGANDAAERNLLSGNLFAGVWITGQGTDGNAVAGNFIGTDISGSVALNNGTQPVFDPPAGVFGGGVVVAAGASGNRIGTDGNSVDDVDERNVIAGSNNDAIDIWGTGTDGNIVAGNFIGTDVTGTRSLGIAGDGVFLAGGASSNWIGANPNGGTAVGDERNVISGNGSDGVQIYDGSNDNVVAGNEIGTDSTGIASLPNGGAGIVIGQSSSNNTIGGTAAAAGNLVTDNSGAGVAVTGYSVGNQITANRIFDNTGQAIDLGNDGVTDNSTSPRQGPNNLQNFPIIVTTADGQTEGWLGGSESDSTYRIDVFASAGHGPGGAGEAQDFLGSLEETTDATGQLTFAVPFTAPSGLPIITATATDPRGNTSEVTAARHASFQSPARTIRLAPDQRVVFSSASSDGITLQDPEAGPLNLVWDLTLSVAAGTLTLSATAGLAGTGDGTGSLAYSGPLSTLNAALDGMTFAPPPGYQGNATLSLDAQSDAALPLQSQVPIFVTSGLFTVISTADSGPGSLRQAILDSNMATGATNTIKFAVPGAGVQTIAPASPLPAISNPVVIDGTSQPGYAGAPLIAIVGQGTGITDPLTVGSDVTVKGLALGGYSFSSVSSSTMMTMESVPLPQTPGSALTYQVVVAAGGDLMATAQALGANTSLSLLDAKGHIVMESDGLSAAEPIDAIDTYIGPGTYSLEVHVTSGNGSFTLTTMLTPADAPFQPIPAGVGTTAMVAGDFNGDGKLDLAVADYGYGYVSVLMGNGDGTFQPAVEYKVGAGPLAIVAGDFNGDGRTDLAVANNISDDVSVLLGNGDGTFQPQVTFAVGAAPTAIVAGDFNGYGRTDLAVVTVAGVSMLLANGDGTFQEPLVTYAVGSNPSQIVAGDFNGDGKLDLAVADGGNQYNGGTDLGGIFMLLGNGDGTFQPAVQYAVGLNPDGIVAGDFTGDGRLDLAVTNVGSNDVSILLGNGDGTFQPPVTYAVGGTPSAILAEDFNGDGKLDLAVSGQGFISVLLGNGDGTFQPQVYTAAGLGAQAAIVAGDFNGNGKLDVAFTNDQSNGVSILLGIGNGTFQSQVIEAVGSSPQAIVAGDFTGDGRLDLAVVNNGSNDVSILLGNGDGTFAPQATYAVGSYPVAIVAGDFNGDGRTDLAVLASDPSGAGEVSVLLGNGDGTFQPAVQYATLSYANGLSTALFAGDFTGDGHIDLAVAGYNFNTPPVGEISVLLGNGDGTFQPAVEYALGSSIPYSIVAGNFSGDGKLDLAAVGYNYNSVTNIYAGEVAVLLGNGDGTFQAPVTYAVGVSPNAIVGVAVGEPAIVAGDFTGDGRLELAVANYVSNNVSILLGNGDGTFQPAVQYAVGLAPDLIVAGDFTGGGRLDLAVGYRGNEDFYPVGNNPGGVSVLLGNGDGTFQPAVQYAAGLIPNFIVTGDFTGDGKLDLAVANQGSSDLSILLGNGDGTFQPAVQYAVGSSPGLIVAGDFTGDGRTDLAVANVFSNTVSMLLGNGDGTFSDPGQFATSPHATPLLADVNGDGTDGVLVVDGAGDILYRQGIPGHPGTFEPPITVNPGFPSRDITWVPNTDQGPVLASVDADDDAISLYVYRDGGFVRVGSLATGRLPAQIVAADLSDDGLDDLIVRNARDGSLSIYSNLDFTQALVGPFAGPVRPGPQPFGSPVTLPVGLGVSDVRAVDTTGSGRLDLVVTNKLTGEVSVLLNQANGTFAPPAPYRAATGLSEIDPGSTPEVASLDATIGVAAGPLTAGALPSLVTINPGSYTLDVLAGLGGGLFANPVTIQTTSPAQVVRMADFTGNGIDDLAVLTANGLSIYLGNGQGGFLPPTTYAVPPETDGLTVADVTGNGKLDLLLGNAYGDVLVLRGNGDGTFQPYHEANQAVELAVADLTGNGSKDIIYADQGLDRVVVDYGAGNSTVLANQSSGLLEPGAVALANLNGPDYPPDLIVANSGSNNVLIYPGLGNGQFGPAINGGHGYFVGTNPVGITVANVSHPKGDPRLDLVVADKGSNEVSILLNTSQNGNISFSAGPRLNAWGTAPVSTVVGHFTGGTYPDLLVTDSGSNDVALLPGVGQGFFNDSKKPTTYPVGTDPVTSFVGNFNGQTDLLTVNAGSNDLTLISGFEGSHPTTSTIASGGVDPDTAFAFASSSGFEDLVVGNAGDGVLSLFEGGANGLTLMSTNVEPSLPSPTDLAFSALSGGQVQFYAATAGQEYATLVALSLSGETLAQSPPGTINNVAQLVPLNESSLALVGTLLTLTIASPGSETNLESAETGAGASGAAAASVSLGQGAYQQGARDDAASGDGEKVADVDAAANPTASSASAWERFILGLDEALERFRREFQGRIQRPDEPKAAPNPADSQPADGSSSGDGPMSSRSTTNRLPNASEHGSIVSPHSSHVAEAIDAIVDSIWGDEARVDVALPVGVAATMMGWTLLARPTVKLESPASKNPDKKTAPRTSRKKVSTAKRSQR